MAGRKCIEVDIRLQGRLETTSVIVSATDLIWSFAGQSSIQAAGPAEKFVKEGFHSGNTGSYYAQCCFEP